jgi:hypothetical protein
MKKQSLFLAFFASSAFLLGGCSNNAQTGALVGSLVGAGLGKSTSNHRDKRAIIGAALGGLVGAAIGSERDRVIRSNTNVATTSPYYSDKPVNSNDSITHTHRYSSGDETHSHPGGDSKHTHDNQTDDRPTTVVRPAVSERVYVYEDEPYYYSTFRPTIIIGGGYYYGGRQYYRHHRRGHYNRHHRRHYRH